MNDNVCGCGPRRHIGTICCVLIMLVFLSAFSYLIFQAHKTAEELRQIEVQLNQDIQELQDLEHNVDYPVTLD